MSNDPLANQVPKSPLKEAIEHLRYLQSLSNKNLTRIERQNSVVVNRAEELDAAATVFLDAMDAFLRSAGRGSVPEPSLLGLYAAMAREVPGYETE